MIPNVSILTRAAAIGLKYGQNLAKENGCELVIYDSYRQSIYRLKSKSEYF